METKNENTENIEVGLESTEFLYQYTPIRASQLAPDGAQIIYAVERIDQATEKKWSDLWLVAADGKSEPRRYTWGDSVDTNPLWSPDGTQIAFLSNRGDGQAMQIHLLPVAGGEARPLTKAKGRITEMHWSPDGTQIAIGFAEPDDDQKAREADEQKKKLGVVAYHIEKTAYKFDGAGFLPKSYTHLWLVDVASGEMTQLLDGTFSVGSIDWAPDSQSLVFGANLEADPGLHPNAGQLYRVAAKRKRADDPLGQADLTQIVDMPSLAYFPAHSPDGQRLAFYGAEQADNWWQNTTLFVCDLATGAVTALSAPFDYDCSPNTVGDIIGATPPQRPHWSADSQTIYTAVSRHGQQAIHAFAADGSGEEQIVAGGTNGLFQIRNGRIAYLNLNFTKPGELHSGALGQAAVQLTNHQAWLADYPHGETEEVWFESKGGTRLQGWILKPPGFDPKQTYPTIIEVHGGPQTQYGNTYMHEFHYLAANGYVVAYSNPRGGQGYGSDHASAIYQQWGTVDVDDIMTWTDLVEALPYVDGDRMGVTGGSYGGLMTAWLLGRTERFKAAVAQRSVTNWFSMFGSADFNHGWSRFVGLPYPWQDPENYWAQSPLSQIGNAKTPTLVIHSLNDFRTNFEQSEQLYVALKVLGVETEMVAFPDESHGLSRIGRTDRRMARLAHILRWFDRYLKA